MKYDLARMYAGRNPRKRAVTFPKVTLPATLASDLYASAYAPVIAEWSKAVPSIIAEYDRSLSQLVRDTAEDLTGMTLTVEAQITGFLALLRLRLDRWTARSEQTHRKRWAAAVKSSTGIDINMLVSQGDMRLTLGNAIERNVDLVRSVSDQTRSRISNAIFSGLQERRAVREVAAQIREAVGMSRKRALLIASDQTSKIAATLNTERAQEAGLEHYEWVSSHKLHFRKEHAARDGKRYVYGHFGADEPGQAIHCGCTARAVLDLDDEF